MKYVGQGAADLEFHAHDIAQNATTATPIMPSLPNSKLAQQRGMSNAMLAYAWLLHQPGFSAPIVAR